MKAGWEVKTLKELTTILGDGLHGTPQYTINGDYYFINGNNLNNGVIEFKENTKRVSIDEFNKYKKNLTNRTILVSINGTLCNVAFYNGEKIILGKSACYFNLKEGIDKNFIKYILSSDYFLEYAHKESTGATIKNVSLKSMREFKAPVPPLPEQQRIVAILDAAFASIATAKANTEQNLKNARALFDSYLHEVFNQRGDDWEEKVLKEVCELKSGTTISTSLERTVGDVLYTKIADMNLPENTVEIHTSSRFANSNEIKQNQIIPEGAIIFPKRGGAIATNKKRKIIKPTIVDLNTMAIIPSKKINKDYFFHWFRLFDLNSISNGANIPQINNYSFDDTYIPYPNSLKEQENIVKKLDALYEETQRLETLYQRKLTALDELKKALLHQAFNGEL